MNKYNYSLKKPVYKNNYKENVRKDNYLFKEAMHRNNNEDTAYFVRNGLYMLALFFIVCLVGGILISISAL